MVSEDELADYIVKVASAWLAPVESGYWAPTEAQTRRAIAHVLEVVAEGIRNDSDLPESFLDDLAEKLRSRA